MKKNVKKANFAFEHLWVLLRDHPTWADGWTQPKSPIGKRKAGASKGKASNLVDAGDDIGGGMHLEGGDGGSQPSPKGLLGGSRGCTTRGGRGAREGATPQRGGRRLGGCTMRGVAHLSMRSARNIMGIRGTPE